MPKRIVECFVVDILLSIDRVKRYSAQISSAEKLFADELVMSCILRELGIIGEAMRHVVTATKLQQFIRPLWHGVVDFRTVVTREYFRLDFDEIFIIIKKHVPALEREMFQLVKELAGDPKLHAALQKAKGELAMMKRKESLTYVKKLEKLLK
jgi:uncharacterized protein with HEPN domain